MTEEQQEQWVSISRAADLMGIGKSTFWRQIKHLIERGLIETRKDLIRSEVILINIHQVRDVYAHRVIQPDREEKSDE